MTETRHGVNFDIYPVGLLHDLQVLRRRKCKRNWRKLYDELKRTYQYAFVGNWRPVKNHFNGYLAEPTNLSTFTRCGSGWTKKRAVDSFFRYNTIRFKSDG